MKELSSFMIDDPGSFASREEWQEFLTKLRTLPQDDPEIDRLTRKAKRELARKRNDPAPTLDDLAEENRRMVERLERPG